MSEPLSEQPGGEVLPKITPSERDQLDRHHKRRKGRPRLLDIDPTLQTRLCTYLSAGTPIRYAALACGVDEDQVMLWTKWGRQHKDEQYINFYRAVQKAIADAVALSVGQVRAAGMPHDVTTTKTVLDADGNVERKETTTKTERHWTAHAWYLERTAPEDFGQNRSEIRALEAELTEARRQVAEMKGFVDRVTQELQARAGPSGPGRPGPADSTADPTDTPA